MTTHLFILKQEYRHFIIILLKQKQNVSVWLNRSGKYCYFKKYINKCNWVLPTVVMKD